MTVRLGRPAAGVAGFRGSPAEALRDWQRTHAAREASYMEEAWTGREEDMVGIVAARGAGDYGRLALDLVDGLHGEGQRVMILDVPNRSSLPFLDEDAIAYIEGLIEQSGGFGTFLMLGHDWANPEATMRSYRLFAEKVIPHFQGQIATPTASHDWATAKRNELFGRAGQAIMNAITEHVEDTSPATAGAE